MEISPSIPLHRTVAWRHGATTPRGILAKLHGVYHDDEIAEMRAGGEPDDDLPAEWAASVCRDLERLAWGGALAGACQRYFAWGAKARLVAARVRIKCHRCAVGSCSKGVSPATAASPHRATT